MYYPGICLEELRRTPKYVKVTGVPGEIRKERLLNTGLGLYSQAELFSRNVIYSIVTCMSDI
jgi:hypothetical protein